MPFAMCFYNPCLLSADSSILSPTRPQSSSSIKSIFRRHFFKKRSTARQEFSTQKLQRTKGSNVVRQVMSKSKSHLKSKTTHNYDMTILHDDELDNSHLATVRRRKKKIPSWANQDQLQLAAINQLYFQKQDPEDIFGTVCINDAFDMINSLDIENKESMPIISSHSFV